MENSLASQFPELAQEWSDKNLPLTADQVSYGAHSPVWWKGKCGHEWYASPHSRTGGKGQGCPYCSGNRVLPGFNDFASKRPELVEEWSDRNIVRPTEVAAFSNRKVYWKGKCGHEWFALISSRSNGHGCPYCSNEKILPGYNDFQTLYPELAEEWSEKNHPLEPGQVFPTRSGYVWWKCSQCGSHYKAWISSRIRGSGCPFCSGRKVIEGKNEILTTDPEIANEWDYEKNRVHPGFVYRTSKKLYWWKSPCGHSWQAKPYERTILHIPCRECEKEFIAELPALLVSLYAGRFGMRSFIHSEEPVGIELEIIVPKMGVVIEHEYEKKPPTHEQEVKKHICNTYDLEYILIPRFKTAIEAAHAIRTIFAERNRAILSLAEDDINLAKKQYQRIKENNTIK